MTTSVHVVNLGPDIVEVREADTQESRLMICKKHPKYLAVRPPKSCQSCQIVYLTKQLEQLKISFYKHSHYITQIGTISRSI